DQRLRDFGPCELDRWNLALRKHLAHACAAQTDMMSLVMRTGFERGHPVALPAIEGVVEKHRRDLQLFRRELTEYQLRVVGAVVIAHAGMVAADDEVRTTVVLPNGGVENGFARPGVPHRRGQHR